MVFDRKAYMKEYNKKYQEINKEQIKKQRKEYRQKPEIKKRKTKYDKKYIQIPKVKKHKKEYYKEYYEKNEEKKLKYMKEYYQKPEVKQYRKEYDKEYNQKNKKRIRERNGKYTSKRRKTDKNFNIVGRLRNLLRIALNTYTKTGKIMSASKYGVDYKAIIEFLKPFPKDLSKYHIDHRKPLCSFNFINEDGSTNLEEVKKAFSPENLQWLTIHENLVKSGKILT